MPSRHALSPDELADAMIQFVLKRDDPPRPVGRVYTTRAWVEMVRERKGRYGFAHGFVEIVTPPKKKNARRSA